MSRSFMSARGWLALPSALREPLLAHGVIWGAPFLLVKIVVRYVASVDEERHPLPAKVQPQMRRVGSCQPGT